MRKHLYQKYLKLPEYNKTNKPKIPGDRMYTMIAGILRDKKYQLRGIPNET